MNVMFLLVAHLLELVSFFGGLRFNTSYGQKLFLFNFLPYFKLSKPFLFQSFELYLLFQLSPGSTCQLSIYSHKKFIKT